VTKGTRTKITVALLTLALVAYFVLLGERALALIRTGGAAGLALGIGVLLLPIIGVILVFWDLPVRPSGRVERDAADAHFESVKARVELAPDDWRGWFALAHAYDLAGDRKRARSAMRHAIELEAGSASG